MPSTRTEIRTLKRLLVQADTILSTPRLAENGAARCRELVSAALALTNELASQAKLPAAAILGQRGGSVTAKRGPEYFRQLAAKRKTRAGGRPRKQPE